MQSNGWLQFRELLEELRWSANRWWSNSLGWGAMALPRNLVQTVTPDICRIIQVLHRPLTLLLHGLNYCNWLHYITALCMQAGQIMWVWSYIEDRSC